MANSHTDRGNFEYSLAGLKVYANSEISELTTSEYTDGSINVVFQKDSNPGKPAGKNWLITPEPTELPIYVSDDGKEIVVYENNHNSVNRPVEVRRALPYASYLQNKAVLHASAILYNGGVIAFIGESGSGKSTLAQELNTQGFRCVSDDLLPCSIVDNQVVVPYLEKYRLKLFPLIGIYFLGRKKELDDLFIYKISKSEFLNLLLLNGFGDLAHSSLWEYQFKFFLKIVENTASFLLDLPDDITKLEQSALDLSKTFSDLK